MDTQTKQNKWSSEPNVAPERGVNSLPVFGTNICSRLAGAKAYGGATKMDMKRANVQFLGVVALQHMPPTADGDEALKHAVSILLDHGAFKDMVDNDDPENPIDYEDLVVEWAEKHGFDGAAVETLVNDTDYLELS